MAALRTNDSYLQALYRGKEPQLGHSRALGAVKHAMLCAVWHMLSTGELYDVTRSVRPLAPLAADLREFRMASGRPAANALLFPGAGGAVWTEGAWGNWTKREWARALKAAKLSSVRPYDLRHSFASLLLHESRSAVYVARQLGHGTQLTLGTYGHVIDELDAKPHIDAETAIAQARDKTSAAHQLPKIDAGGA